MTGLKSDDSICARVPVELTVPQVKATARALMNSGALVVGTAGDGCNRQAC